MILERNRFQELLNTFRLDRLFNEIGWDHAAAQAHLVQIGDERFTLTPIAQKRGVTIFQCSADATGAIPPRPTLLKIEKQAGKLAHEHLLIFTDQAQTTQTWLWVSRAPGQPAATRTHTWHEGSSGESLRQKLEHIAFTLSEEESITLTLASHRLRDAFDRDRVTKKFYKRFAEEHGAFTEFITGITARASQQWYASLMLNRLMFVYFIQKKGFLDDNVHYLGERLRRVQAQVGKGQFHSFYRQFLKRLFHEGLGQSKPRGVELDALLGDIPYLNGGLFDVHELEEAHSDIDIPDEAFERLFGFFEAYDWHLDDRPLASGSEINPDVLGYIFEKYINQKQMGAYYTKEDITGYIAKNTIVPFLLERARERCKVAFEGGASVWSLLAADPDRYLYPAMRRGVVDKAGEVLPETALPDFVQTGMHDAKVRMFDKRYNLGAALLATPDGEDGTLPTETWREYVERRRRCLDIRQKMQAGELRTVDDLITYNLDIRQFMQDVIEQYAGAELLRAIWQAMVGRVPEKATEHFRHGLTVLDPTCGSGAFLFAALNVLEPLYEACIERMEGLLDPPLLPGEGPGLRTAAERKHPDFRKVTDEVNRHPSRRYFIFKSIVAHNLFGVDIMAEAVEICKLRLFLKLVSQVETVSQLEPLPDIDFNIRTGNTLVGYATLEQLRASANLASNQDQLQEIGARAADLADAFDRFREQQTKHGGTVTAKDKRALRERLAKLALELDRFLAMEYGKNPEKPREFNDWRESHQPFHWMAEFYGVMRDGGFDVVIGNPPYVVYSAAKVPYDLAMSGLNTLPAANLYAYVIERSAAIAKASSPISLIVQLTAISSGRMEPLQDLLLNRGALLCLPYPRRPESMFDGVEMPVVILSSYTSAKRKFYTSRIGRMYGDERPTCLQTPPILAHEIRFNRCRIAKVHSQLDLTVIKKVAANSTVVQLLVSRSGDFQVFYQEACRYWLKAQAGLPFFSRNGVRMRPPHGRVFSATSRDAAAFLGCLLNSSFFYWYYSLLSDCEHVNDDLVKSIPIPKKWNAHDWARLSDDLESALTAKASRKSIRTKQGHVIEYDEMKASRCKDQIDKVDRALAAAYGFHDGELDFIINYDIKYRMGGTDAEE